MTISNQSSESIFLGNNTTVSFQFPWVGVAAADINVIYTSANGTQTPLSPNQYTLTLNAALPGQLWGVGGTVTYPLVGSPIANGTSLTVQRILPFTQTTSISNQGAVYPQVTEIALDTLCMQLQQLDTQVLRCIQIPAVDPSNINVTLPAAALRANTFLGFDVSGNVVVLPGTGGGSGSISPAMQPVVSASTVAAALALLGGVSNALPSGDIYVGNASNVAAVTTLTAGTNISLVYTAASGPTPANLTINCLYNFFCLQQFFPGIPAGSALMAAMVQVGNVAIPLNFSGSQAIAQTASTGTAVITVKKNGSTVGTITFSASTAGVFATSGGAFTMVAGDVISLTNQGSSDATLANISVSILGTRS